MSRVFYFGEVDFLENRSAAVLRILNNCKAIHLTGQYLPVLVGYSNFSSNSFESFSILNLRRGSNLITKFFLYLIRGLSVSFKLFNKVKKGDIVIYYGSSFRVLFPLFLLSKIKRFPLLVDLVEWYDYRNLPFGKFGPLSLDVEICLKFLVPRVSGLIVISSYLENYFKRFKIPCIKVPILLEERENINTKKKGLNSLNLVYAGYAGKKDLIGHVIQAVTNLNISGYRIYFHIFGMTKEEVKLEFGDFNECFILAKGRVSREDVAVGYCNSDFSVLFRPNLKFTNAGFPTKFVESISFGLPVIGNLTSDLSVYLIDEYNGFVSENISLNSIESVLLKAFHLNEVAYFEMKKNSFNSFKSNFLPVLYKSEFNKFLSGLK
jgi:glycosyltransferase involved in cell wall biosynthesis